MNKQARRLLFPGVISILGAFVVAILLFSAFAPIGTHATGPNLGANISTPDTIESGGYYILLEHNPTTNITLENADANGFYGYNHDSLKVYTNSPSGYQLYISSDQEGNFNQDGSGDSSTASNAIPGNSLFKDGTLGNTEYFAPTTGTFTPPSTAVSTGGTTIGSTTDRLDQNSWGFSLTQNDKYAPIPLKNEEQVIKRTRLDNSAQAPTHESVAQDIYFGVRSALNKTAGTYSGNVLYTAMSDADDTLDGMATITPSSTENLDGGDEVTINTSLFTNMEDLGPIEVYIGNYTSTSDTPVSTDACTNVQSSIDTDANNNLVITCNTPAKSGGAYGVLVKVDKFEKTYLIANGFEYIQNAPEFFTITYMQDMTPEICAAVTTPANTATQADTDGSHHGDTAYVAQRTLYDYRDNNTYMVRKLADGNCWMSENLKLNLGTYSAPVTVKRAQYNSTYTEDWTPTGTGGYNAVEPLNNNTKTPAPDGNYYYSWYAATAGSGTFAQINTEAEYSICPSGWKLPANYTISTTKSYGSMTNAYSLTTNGANNTTTNTSTFEAFPLSFARTGYYDSGSPAYVGTYGYGSYWSSTAYSDATYAYHLTYGTYGASGTYPQGSYHKYRGLPVRCVAL